VTAKPPGIFETIRVMRSA